MSSVEAPHSIDLRGRRVLLLDGELRAALAVVRSIGRSGATVFVGAAVEESLAAASRFCTRSCVYPNPATSEQAFVDRISVYCSEHSITDLLPMSEVALGTLLRHRERFSGVSLPFVERDTYDLAVDKHRLAQLAETVGVRVPKSFLCVSAADVEPILPSIVYPAVLKPTRSRIYADGRWIATQVQYAADEAQLRQHLLTYEQYTFAFMIQEFVVGMGAGVFFLYDRGREIARFSHRRLREKPPTGGVSVLCESAVAAPALFDQASRLLNSLQWHGVAMVEFKVTAAGEPYLMEINPRFWGSLQLAVDAGVDFPSLLLALHQRPQPVRNFKEGVRLRWLLGDLDHLIIVLRSDSYPLSLKWRAALEFLNVFPLSTRYETGRIDDMWPFLRELQLYLRDLLKGG